MMENDVQPLGHGRNAARGAELDSTFIERCRNGAVSFTSPLVQHYQMVHRNSPEVGGMVSWIQTWFAQTVSQVRNKSERTERTEQSSRNGTKLDGTKRRPRNGLI